MKEIHLTFPNMPQNKANQLAQELLGYLNTNTTEKGSITKEKDNTQDFGATLVLVLGTGSAIALARGIADWMRKKPETAITVKTKDGEVVVQNVRSGNAREVLETALKGLNENVN